MKNWLGRAIIFLLAGSGTLWSLHYASTHFKPERQIILLNRTRPDFSRFLSFNTGLKEYFDYFRLVKEAMPDNSDGSLMLGYLYAITGDQAKAGILFKEAYRMDPQFFFTGFNLALVLFNQGEYGQSAGLLKGILTISPDRTLNRMTKSIIYRQIFASVKDRGDIITGLRQSYHDADILLLEASAKSGHYKELQGEDVNIQIHARVM